MQALLCCRYISQAQSRLTLQSRRTNHSPLNEPFRTIGHCLIGQCLRLSIRSKPHGMHRLVVVRFVGTGLKR